MSAMWKLKVSGAHVIRTDLSELHETSYIRLNFALGLWKEDHVRNGLSLKPEYLYV